jgi:hypothetical protein
MISILNLIYSQFLDSALAGITSQGAKRWLRQPLCQRDQAASMRLYRSIVPSID